MYTLGINAVYHDSAACLVKDGNVVAAAEEERFTHIKHGKRPVPFSTYELPFHAIDYCLREAGIELSDVEHIGYSFDPYLLLDCSTEEATISLPLEPSAHASPANGKSPWDDLFLSYVVNAPRHLAGGVPHHLKARFRGVRSDGPFKWHFLEHHLTHAASAFNASPFQEAAVLTLDGRGEKATSSYNLGSGTHLERLGQVNMPHSLGILYEQVTEYLGFLHSSDEYKVMALASYGKPRYLKEFREIVQAGAEGQYHIQSPRLVERFGPPRERGAALDQRHFDIAHSLQMVLEETVLEIATWLYSVTRVPNLCLAGGVALNCVMNARLRERGPFKQIWVQPASGDAGTALGAALWLDACQRGVIDREYKMDHAFLGPSFSDNEIEQFLKWSKLPYRRLENIAEQTAALLADNKIIGWFQGRMEYGPRALGARSILASPIDAEMQARLNEIKDREDFRPVAPVVLEEEVANWFNQGDYSPFMLFIFDVLPEKAHLIPAVRHTDGTARIQTINRQQNALYYDLLKAFQARTGVPVLVNTSFNTRGEPIVCTPRDAIECFWTSPLDALVIGSFMLQKPE
ncbi:MAG TPA: carbamoyltransferase C-terminal domain-containing protein [Chloroflexia bacterium]|nr:carbamoyltransferase C-terminal domain-containing protein [Chloroflexia bacterium]